MGEVNYMREEDVKLDAVRARFSNVLKRHSELAERLSRCLFLPSIMASLQALRLPRWLQKDWCFLPVSVVVFSGIVIHIGAESPNNSDNYDSSRDSDKSIFERLQREFEAARASQTQELTLEGEQWNDGLLATIRERVHMEAERKAMQIPGDTTQLPIPFHEKITYKVGNKIICCLDGARIGIQYETSFAGESCDLYHCVLESKSFLEKMTVLEHTVPFFLPIREAENEFLSSNAMSFTDHVGDLLQAYVDRREQVRLIKELYGNQIGELYHSLPYHMIEFVLEDFDSKVTVGLRYADLISTLPTGVSVLAWPMHQSKKSSDTIALSQKGNGVGSHPFAARLTYAENALRNMSLPEAYAEIVLNLPQALQDMFPHTSST